MLIPTGRHSFQITQNHVVVRLLSHYKQELSKVVKELRMPYTIEVLAQIRRDCFLRHFSTPNALRKLHSEVSHMYMHDYNVLLSDTFLDCFFRKWHKMPRNIFRRMYQNQCICKQFNTRTSLRKLYSKCRFKERTYLCYSQPI